MVADVVQSLKLRWRRDPIASETGPKTGVSGALWEWRSESRMTVSAEAPQDHFVLAFFTRPFFQEFWRDGHLVSSGTNAPFVSRVHHPGASARTVLEGTFGCLYLFLPLSHVAASATAAELPRPDSVTLIDPALRPDPAIAAIGRTLLAEIACPDRIARLRFELLTQDLTLHLLRRWSNTGAHAPSLAKGGLAPWQTRRVLDYMRAHLADDIGLADLAAQAGLSTFHFVRTFRHTMGAPPHRYLAHLRVERARHLLETTDMPVTEVAAAVGYQTPQALARVFRRDMGSSPGEWRRLRPRP